MTKVYLAEKTDLANKQDTLISGTNIKTINNESILGSGNLNISSGKTFFLGYLSQYGSTTPLDLNSLDVGEYIIGVPHQTNWNTRLYFKATVNNAEVTGNYRFSKSNAYMLYDYVVLSVYQKISDMTFVGSNYNTFGLLNFEYRQTTTGSKEVSYNTYQINVSVDNISTPNISNVNFVPVEVSEAQTITGKKTFNTLPESSVTPTTDYQLVNKKYVDDNAGGGGTPIYLGRTTDFTANNRLDVSDLDVGVYFIVLDYVVDDIVSDKTLYLQFTNNNNTKTSDLVLDTTGVHSSIVYLQICKKISTTTFTNDYEEFMYIYNDYFDRVNMKLAYTRVVYRGRKNFIGFSFDINNSDYYKYSVFQTENVAPDFSTSSTYEVGDYVMYRGYLYVCTTAVTTAGDFSPSKWTQTTITDIIKNL